MQVDYVRSIAAPRQRPGNPELFPLCRQVIWAILGGIQERSRTGLLIT